MRKSEKSIGFGYMEVIGEFNRVRGRSPTRVRLWEMSGKQVIEAVNTNNSYWDVKMRRRTEFYYSLLFALYLLYFIIFICWFSLFYLFSSFLRTGI